MTVFINLLSLICHTCLILSALWYKHALGTHISLLYFLTGTILVNTVAYLSGAEAVLAFLGLFFDAWRWKLVFLIRICIVLTGKRPFVISLSYIPGVATNLTFGSRNPIKPIWGESCRRRIFGLQS
jgi:hypothetical protein